MLSDHAPRMSRADYERYLAHAGEASSPEALRALRAEVSRRWGGDPLADDLSEALAVHLARSYGGVEEAAEAAEARGPGLLGRRRLLLRRPRSR